MFGHVPGADSFAEPGFNQGERVREVLLGVPPRDAAESAVTDAY